jgi:parallel beta-helix repeat protein
LVPTSVRAGSGIITVPDDYPAIQTAINAANVGDTVFVRNATYYENVVVNKTVLFVGESPETTIVDGGQGDSAIMIVVDNVTVEGFIVRSTCHYESGTDLASVRLKGVKYCNITANILTGGDVGVFLDTSSNNDIAGNNVTTTLWPMWFTQASANSVHDNEFVNSSFGINLLSSNENTIFNSRITNIGGINLSPLCFGNVITANNFSNNWPGVELGSDVWERSPYWGMVQNTTVTDNTFVDGGIFAGYTYGNTVENNTVSGKPIVYLEGVSDRKIKDAGQVILMNCSRVQIENLYLLNACVGVELREDSNITVTGNNVTEGALGIALYDTSNTNITGNTLKGGGASAIWLQSSSNNTISQNNIVDNGGYGIELQSNSDNNRIFHNSLIGNALGGNVWPNQTIIENLRATCGMTGILPEAIIGAITTALTCSVVPIRTRLEAME